MKKVLLALALFLNFSSLLYSQSDDFLLRDLSNRKIHYSLLMAQKVNVLVFFSPECPICQSSTLPLKELMAKYSNDSVRFTLVYPQSFTSRRVLKRFQKKYIPNITGIMDSNNKIVKKLSAIVTPECFVLNATGEVIYSGKIDNGFAEIGKRRLVVTEKYLNDAIQSELTNQEVVIKRTEPVGCFIEK